MVAVWADALTKAAEEAGLADFPEVCPRSEARFFDLKFLPE
jgi:hypothetical protein